MTKQSVRRNAPIEAEWEAWQRVCREVKHHGAVSANDLAASRILLSMILDWGKYRATLAAAVAEMREHP